MQKFFDSLVNSSQLYVIRINSKISLEQQSPLLLETNILNKELLMKLSFLNNI